MRIHILGIGGSFMAGIAVLAKALHHQVSGSDKDIYPPMSTQLQEHGIAVLPNYNITHLQPAPDLVIIGNAMSRGNPLVEYILDNKLPYISGPQWLSEEVLLGKHVLAISGTHGKTTTSSILSFILEQNGYQPGFIIGGLVQNFGVSARLGKGKYFIVEADEYDTAFFDKRSKFIHYCPDTLVINNIEYDHADIFDDLQAILRQFHHLIRVVPSNAKIICGTQPQIANLLAMGCWSKVEYFSSETKSPSSPEWSLCPMTADFSKFDVLYQSQIVGKVDSSLFGEFNAENTLAAIAAANHVGIKPAKACQSLAHFQNAKCRLQRLACVNKITVYADFAHHPTAIKASLKALRQRFGTQRIIAILEPCSNTMRLGVHKDVLASALVDADHVYLYATDDLPWDLTLATANLGDKVQVMHTTDAIIAAVSHLAIAGDHILVMSNGAFDNLPHKLIDSLA